MSVIESTTSRVSSLESQASTKPRLWPGLKGAWAALAYALAAPKHGWRNELLALQVEHVTLRWPDLPPALHGLRIVQLSDLHAASWLPDSLLRRGVQLAQAQSPDLVLLTGDFVQYGRDSAYWAAHCAEILAPLRAPLGVYGSLGNHDHWGGPEKVVTALERVGIPVLVNAARRLSIGGTGAWLVGIDSVRNGRPDFRAALADVPADGFKILMAHEPDMADRAVHHAIQLQLSGHSHGGQIVIPGVPTTWLPSMGRKYPRGLYRVGRMWLYTNRGLGAGFPPIRHNCPPEVTLIRLEREE